MKTKKRTGSVENKKHHDDGSKEASTSSFRVYLPGVFLIYSTALVVAFSFGIGKLARHVLATQTHHQQAVSNKLPPVYISSDVFPATVYTGQNFDTSFPAISDSVLARQDYSESSRDVTTTRLLPKKGSGHHSAGQHILMDIRNVDGPFLNSASQLAQAMIHLAEYVHLQLLSYHCHALIPIGVTCVGVMLKSHITFHTWPEEGVITLDLLTFQRDEQIDSVVQGMEEFFGVSSPLREGPPESKWALKKRGFRVVENEDSLGFHRFLLGSMEFENKTQVLETQTSYHDVRIYDSFGYPRRLEDYQESLDVTNGSYESQHPHLFLPDRTLLVDGAVQSRRYGQAAYYETLVHPTLLMHPHPRKVAIVGGCEGSVLREVLKHKSVEYVVMLEKDKELVRLVRTFLPEGSDCSMIAGSTKSCFDDSRADIKYTDGVQWFTDNASEAVFDVVIVASQPNFLFETSSKADVPGMFYSSVYNSLSAQGVLLSLLDNKSVLDLVQRAGFYLTDDISEARGGIAQSLDFLRATKNRGTSKQAYNEGATALALRNRLLPSSTGEPLLHFFDGATLVAYNADAASKSTVRSRCTANTEPGAHPDTCWSQFSSDDLLYNMTSIRRSIVAATSKLNTAAATPKQAGHVPTANLHYHRNEACSPASLLDDSTACEADMALAYDSTAKNTNVLVHHS